MRGEDAVIRVPPGTILKSDEGEVIRDLVEPEEPFSSEGGRGGAAMRGLPFAHAGTAQGRRGASRRGRFGPTRTETVGR